jgi:hypothetical protein
LQFLQLDGSHVTTSIVCCSSQVRDKDKRRKYFLIKRKRAGFALFESRTATHNILCMYWQVFL